MEESLDDMLADSWRKNKEISSSLAYDNDVISIHDLPDIKTPTDMYNAELGKDI